jgi:hypothetical protein
VTENFPGDAARIFQRLVARDVPPELATRTAVGNPAAVHGLDGSLSHWHVPFLSDSRAIGFMDVSADGSTLLRSGFRASRISQLQQLPTELTEMSTDEILTLAKGILPTRATPRGTPELVTLSGQTRLAWKVPMLPAEGPPVDVFVTPGIAFTKPPESPDAE